MALPLTPLTPQFEGLAEVGRWFTWVVPYALRLTGVRLTARTAPSDGSLTVDIQKNGTAVTTMTLTDGSVDSGATTVSLSFTAGDVLRLYITAVGPTDPGSSLTATLDGEITSSSAGPYYSEPDSAIILFLRQIGIGSAKTDVLTTDQLTTYKYQANQAVDNHLGAVYRVPLRQITRGTTTGYPPPIPFVAQRIVAWLIVNDIFSESEPNASSNAERNYKAAMDELNQIADRAVLLDGQRLRSRNFGSNPHTEPLAPRVPVAPAGPPV